MRNFFRKKTKNRVLSGESSVVKQEAYKFLRLKIFHLLDEQTPGTDLNGHALGITGVEQQGLVSTNLAVSIAQAGKKVLLIEADLGDASINKLIGIESEYGLDDIVEGEKEPEIVIKDTEIQNLWYLPSGGQCPDPSRILVSDRMKKLIRRMRDRYDYIILNLPRASFSSDAAILSSEIDGYLMVVSHRRTDRKKLDKAFQVIKAVDGRILGVIYTVPEKEGKKYFPL